MIQFINVTKKFDTQKGVFDLNFILDEGITGFLGKNGAGKTTTINLLMGFLKPSQGQILFDNKNLWSFDNVYKLKQNIGFLPNDEYFFDYLSGRENLEYLSILKKKDKKAYLNLEDYIKLLDVESFIDDPFSSYSTGMKKKIQLLGAMIGNPKILIFDEPNNGLDIIANILLSKLPESVLKNK